VGQALLERQKCDVATCRPCHSGRGCNKLDGWIELNVARGVDALLAAEELMFGRWHLHRFLKGKLRKLKGFEEFMWQEKDHLPIFGDFIFSLKVKIFDVSATRRRLGLAFGVCVWLLCCARGVASAIVCTTGEAPNNRL